MLKKITKQSKKRIIKPKSLEDTNIICYNIYIWVRYFALGLIKSG